MRWPTHILAALAGRRIAVAAGQDDARRELRACAAQLAAAMAQIASMGRNLATAENDLAAYAKRHQEVVSQVASLTVANRRLIELLDARPAAPGTASVAPGDNAAYWRAKWEQDRRNVVELENRLAAAEGRTAIATVGSPA